MLLSIGVQKNLVSLILYFVFEQFTKREPEDTKSADSDRDIFNEKPSKEEVMAATQAEGPKRVSDSAIIHTTMGDIHIKLFPVEYVLFLFCFLAFDRSLVWDSGMFIYFFASQVPQNSGELLRPQQEQLLQRPHIPSRHQGISTCRVFRCVPKDLNVWMWVELVASCV